MTLRTVRDEEGEEYLLVTRSDQSSLVRDPETGAERYVPNEDLELVDDDPLETVARAVPERVRRLLRAVHSDASLGLLLDLDRNGPLPVRDLLARYEFCESDLQGALAEFVAAGLIEETTIAGERGYRVTEEAGDALNRLRAA